MNGFRIVTAGDCVLLAEFEDRIDAAVNARAIAFADGVRAAGVAGVRDVVPTFRSVAIYFDPLRTNQDRLRGVLMSATPASMTTSTADHHHLDVPVCYDADLGPDLDDVATRAGLDREAVIALHTQRTYRVFMLGFVPGFAYLGTLDPRLALPRRAVPRPAVSPGSVAIAGGQTCVYPSRTPGGWHVIGRTPIRMFAPDRPASSLLEAGDTVTFAAIDRAEFARLAAAQGTAA